MPPSNVLRLWLPTIAAFFAGLVVSCSCVWLFEHGRLRDNRQEVADLTNLIADDIHDNLERSLSSTYAMAAVIRQSGGSVKQFNQLATEMLSLYHGVSSLQLAPNGIITEIVPLAGNEKAIGHNLLEDTKRNKEALLAYRTRALTLAGPFDLIQGGKAVIGRLPVYIKNGSGGEYFWGFSIAMIRLPEFFHVIDIHRLAARGYKYEISRIHPDTGNRDVFSASGHVLKNPVRQNIPVPNGEWTLSVEPEQGWYSASALAVEAAFIILFSGFTAIAVWFLLRQPQILQKMVDERTLDLSEANSRLQKEILERRRTEDALMASEHKLRSILSSLTDVILILDADGRYVEIAPTKTDMLYQPPADLIGKCIAEVFSKEQADFFVDTIRKTLATGTTISVEYSLPFGGKQTWFTGNVSPLSDKTVVWSARDITQRKKSEEERLELEKQMLNAQKLESLGILAGGIAHDFNNILVTIVGNVDLAILRLSPESPIIENLKRIEEAAARAADLAKQMLAYSGKGRFVVQELDLNRLVQEMGHMLQVSISKKAVIHYHLHEPLPSITADATQIRQIIMNLVINASEAIGDRSGVICITTGVQECSEPYVKDCWLSDELVPGSYVFLEICDNGCGMDKDTVARIFEPFFTTKFTGRGLGMAAVLGIVRGHKGAIKVYSEVNKGSTFKILLPAGAGPADRIEVADAFMPEWRGHGTILLVDDEENVRTLGAEMLRVLGYEVVTASDGRQGLEIFRSRQDIKIVILDLTMPHMDGDQCFRELRKHDPDVKVIMTSGYNEQEITQKFAGKGLVGFVQKPYRLTALREVLIRQELLSH